MKFGSFLFSAIALVTAGGVNALEEKDLPEQNSGIHWHPGHGYILNITYRGLEDMAEEEVNGGKNIRYFEAAAPERMPGEGGRQIQGRVLAQKISDGKKIEVTRGFFAVKEGKNVYEEEDVPYNFDE